MSTTDLYKGIYYGNRIFVQPPGLVKIKRTWRERLFSLTPFKTFKMVLKDMLDDGQVVRMHERLVMNQTTFQRMKTLLENVK
jgi:hypothetical protein